ncbi:hypothetical protein LCGC14_2564530, partial [marine sediment metagenome]
MVDRNLIRSLGITDESVKDELAAALGDEQGRAGLEQALDDTSSQFQVGSILKGKIVTVVGNDAYVEVGLK